MELMETLNPLPQTQPAELEQERLSYSIHEAAALLGVDYFSVYRLIQRGKLQSPQNTSAAVGPAPALARATPMSGRAPGSDPAGGGNGAGGQK